MTLAAAEKLPPIRGGQFLQFEIPSRPDFILRRPFCVCKHGAFTVTIIYAAIGKGTRAMTELEKGAEAVCTLPLGNGFFMLEPHHKNIALVGGGVGCAPLLPVIQDYKDKKFYAYAGFKNKGMVILEKDFKKSADGLKLFTDDGSAGIKGFPTDALRRDLKEGLKIDAVLTCGPDKMMREVQNICREYNIKGFMTGENRMGCGVGACIVCTCKVKRDGVFRNVRSCIEGPVFDIESVEI